MERVLVMRRLRVWIGMAAMTALVALCWPAPALDAQSAAEPAAPVRPAFSEYLAGVREEALSRGLTAAGIDAALSGLEPLAVVVDRDRSQAETVLSIEQYVTRRLTRTFVRAARQRALDQRTLLKKIAGHYHVQPRFVVAIWGLESNFGRFSGVRPIVQALATLAWEGRREALFRGELFAALEILDRGYIDPPALKGSWAGAMGQTQFMPTSYLKFAEDFDGDGQRDIWRSTPDVLASIANYLQAHGWEGAANWGREVRLPAGGWRGMIEKVGLRTTGCRAHREMTEPLPVPRWRELGVRTSSGKALPRTARPASLVSAGRRSFLVYRNYEALLDYNCAHAYALTVGLLADRVGD